MEKMSNPSYSSSSQVISSFMALEGILNSEINSAQEKSTAWRQQSIILTSMDESFANDLMDRHWTRHCASMVNCEELQKNKLHVLGNSKSCKDIEFPKTNDLYFPDDLCQGNMFTEAFFESDHQACENIDVRFSKINNNKPENLPCKTRNTMESFLQGHMSTKQQQPTFCTARQLLSVQTSKKQQTESASQQQRNIGSYALRPDVGFNFAATKKSLGSLGRIVNSRNSFVPPVQRKARKEINIDSNNEENVCTDTDLLPSHPALKNVDPKMVELINNEIIHKYRPVDWNEIAGLDYAKSIIKEAVVYPLLRPDIFTGLRRPPKGILLFGPPGTGKTLIGKCIASQSNSTFFSISSASLTSKWMGEAEKMVRALFAVAVARQPSVIFIDEIDSLLSQRSENENEGTRRLKTEFLVRLDGAATSDDDRVLIVGATNRPQELDEAVRRRFVKRLYVPLPEVDARAQILTNLLKTVENNLSASQIKEISQLTEGYSGADMDSLCREASMEPLRSLPAETLITFRKENLRYVNVDDFYSALKKIRPSVSQNDLNHYVKWNKMYGSSF